MYYDRNAEVNTTFGVSPIKLLLSQKWSDRVHRVKIFCGFSKSESWYRDAASYVLEHDIGHFDMGEVVAQMFRKRLPDMYGGDNSLVKKNVDFLFAEYTKILIDKQNLDDNETCNSQNELEQNGGI